MIKLILIFKFGLKIYKIVVEILIIIVGFVGTIIFLLLILKEQLSLPRRGQCLVQIVSYVRIIRFAIVTVVILSASV